MSHASRVLSTHRQLEGIAVHYRRAWSTRADPEMYQTFPASKLHCTDDVCDDSGIDWWLSLTFEKVFTLYPCFDGREEITPNVDTDVTA